MADRRTVAAVAVAALLPLLAGCGGDDGDPPSAAPTQTEPLWNPCDALGAQGVGRRLGTPVVEENGTPTEPRCSFKPEREGDPVVAATYQIFPAGLEEAWQTMGRSRTATVTQPPVPGATATRLVVEVDHGQLFVTGFVQNGDLIQTVNAIDPEPFDRKRVTDTVVWALGRLSRQAGDAGFAAD